MLGSFILGSADAERLKRLASGMCDDVVGILLVGADDFIVMFLSAFVSVRRGELCTSEFRTDDWTEIDL